MLDDPAQHWCLELGHPQGFSTVLGRHHPYHEAWEQVGLIKQETYNETEIISLFENEFFS